MKTSLGIHHSKKSKVSKKNNSFADFFCNAPLKEKKKVFNEAAKQTNADQRAVYKRAGMYL